jgi:uncharacterized protein RhaS with RHS repeats
MRSNAVTQRNFAQGQYVGTTAYFYTRDHLGSIREMFTGGGTVVARYDYDPFGRSTTVLGTTPTDFNFTGLFSTIVGTRFQRRRNVTGQRRWCNRIL